MSDLMLHGVLNMPLPDDPAEMDMVTWLQFRDRARDASAEIERLRYVLEGVRGAIDTGRNEPLMIWRDQINIALGEPSS